jgi:hypothetical protein
MLAISADVQMPKDVTEVGVQVRDSSRTVLFERWYSVHAAPSGAKLPATLALEPGTADGPVQIRLVARQGLRTLALKEAETTLPRQRTALLRMPIEWLSFGMIQPTSTADVANLGAAGAHDSGFPAVESTCPKGQTPVAGSCESAVVDSATLPAYSAGSVFGSGTGKGDGECFDTAKCFESVIPLIITNFQDCTALPTQTVNDPTHATVGLVAADGSGVCGKGGCIVPLDFVTPGTQGNGWTVDGKGIHLPKAVCRKLEAGSIRAVVGTTLCKSKQLATPLCGAWSSVKSDTSNVLENPGTLASCRAFVRAACDGIARCRGGVGLPPGALDDSGSCSERMAYWCDASLALPESQGFRAYFEACAAAFKSPCEQLDAEVRRACVEPEASLAPKAVNEICHFGECGSGLTCFGAQLNGIGVCTARLGTNQLAPCSAGPELDVLLPQGACASGLYCDASNQQCQTPQPLGAACVSDASCIAGTSCSAGRCAAVSPEGAPCVASSDCAYGLACLGNAAITRCVDPQDPAATCHLEPANSACAASRYVSDGTSCDANSTCLPPAQCLDAKCRLRPIFGANPLTMQPVPGSFPCSSGLSMCALGCKNLVDDAQNCGECGHACAPNTGCVAGRCESSSVPDASGGTSSTLSLGGATATGGARNATTSIGGSTTTGPWVSPSGGTNSVSSRTTETRVTPFGGATSATGGAGGTGGASWRTFSGAGNGGTGGIVSPFSGGTRATGGNAAFGGQNSSGSIAPSTGGVSGGGQSTGTSGPLTGGQASTGGQCTAGGDAGSAGVAGFNSFCPVTPPSSDNQELPNLTVTTQGFITSGAWHGFAWSSADSIGSTTSEPLATLTPSGVGVCADGEIVRGTAENPGWVDLGFNLQQSSGGIVGSQAPSGAGVYIDIDNRGVTDLRLEISQIQSVDQQGNDNTKRWCTEIAGGPSFVPWSAFRERCWTTGGAPYHYEPLASVEVVVPSPVQASAPFDFCILRLGEYGHSSSELVTASGFIGGDSATTADDPMGIQGPFWVLGDNIKYTPPPGNPCSPSGCCMNGATVIDPTGSSWGAVLGFDLKWYETGQLSGAPSACPYRGAADCFDVTFAGTTGGSELQFKARSTPIAPATNETNPLFRIGAFSNGWSGRLCFADLACPSWSPNCSVTNDWYGAEFVLMGGTVTSNFDFCLTSLRAIDNQGAP